MFAQFWLKVTWVPWINLDITDIEGLYKFPKQLYAMHLGPWMNWWSYSMQLVALILSAIWLHNSLIKVGESKNKLNNYKK